MKFLTKKNILRVLVILVSLILVQSLFFKFTAAPEAVAMFSTLNTWAENTFGISNLFLPPGIFNYYIVGASELATAVLLLVGTFTAYKFLTSAGAVLGVATMIGAIFFHLFTPLGIDVQSDGGTLFGMSVFVFVASIVIFVLNLPNLKSSLSK